MLLKRGWTRTALTIGALFGLAVSSIGDLRAQSPASRPSLTTRDQEDDRNPAVFERNMYAMTDRMLELGTGAGLAPEVLSQLTDLRQKLELVSSAEYAAAAAELGPEIGRANRTLSRIVLVTAESVAEPEDPARPPVQTLAGSAWAFDPGGVVIARYPSFDFNVQDNPSQSADANTSGRVCSNDTNRGCSADSECAPGTCVDRPTTSSGSGQISIFASCTVRPDDATIQNLMIVSTVFEGVMMVASRVCDQQFFGFNVSLVCIITDLLFLFNRSILDFEVMCADRWSGAENQSAYDRLGHLHGDIEGGFSGVGTQLTTDFSALNLSIDTKFTSTSLFFTNLGLSIDTHFTQTNTQIDTHFQQTQTFVDQKITDARNVIQAQLTAQANALTDLFLQAEVERALKSRNRLAMYYLPEAQGGQLGRIRQIVEQTIQRVAASGESTYQAQQQLQYAITDVNARRYKRAFNYFCTAYFEAIKILGEGPTP